MLAQKQTERPSMKLSEQAAEYRRMLLGQIQHATRRPQGLRSY